jgi:hypothetical protein
MVNHIHSKKKKLRINFNPSLKVMIGNPFVILSSVDSTNNYAMKEARKGNITDGSVFAWVRNLSFTML